MRTPQTLAATLVFAALMPALAAAPTQGGVQDTPAVRRSAADVKRAFFALQDEFDEATNAYRAAITKLRRDKPDAAAADRPVPPNETFFPRFLALAGEGSLVANLWVVQNHAYIQLDAVAGRADKLERMNRLLTADLSNEQLVALVRVASMDVQGRGVLSKEDALGFLDKVVETATDPEVQSTAALSKASALDVRGGTRDERAAAIAAMKAVAVRWPDTTSGQRAEGQVFAFENLQIGMTAPEIAGQDVDGNPMKLSDFEGKVRVLDFWGFW